MDAEDQRLGTADGTGGADDPAAVIPPEHITFADVFRVGEFRALWSAQILSLIGDQLAIVALTWLVYERSQSPLYAALTYAISFMPWLIGGPLLSGLADRLPRREVMVVADLARAVVMLAMATGMLPIWALCTLLFVGELFAPPFSAARAAVMPDILPGDRYVVGTAINNITMQLGQVVGFGAAGFIVGSLDPSVSLGLNAATFVLSAVLLRVGLERRPAARVEPVDHAGRPALMSSFVRDAAAGFRLVFGRRELRTITGLALLCVFYVVPEGLVAPYAKEIGGGPATAGLLLAAIPTGAVVGAALFSRWVSPRTRFRSMGLLAVATCAPLTLCALGPGAVLTLVLFFVAGLGTAYQLAANAAFVIAVPPESRGQAFGLVQGLMNVGQGAAIVLAGAAAQFWTPNWVVAGTAAVGTVVAVVLARAWRASLADSDARAGAGSEAASEAA